MNDQTRKLLTEYLDEIWHNTRLIVTHCDTCKCAAVNRTFTNPDDMDALRRKMVEKGDWSEFYYYGMDAFANEIKDHVKQQSYVAWLIEPARFCELAGEWIGRKG